MPRKTYGPTVRHRVADFLDSLLSYVNGELDVVGCDLRFRWQDEGTSTPQLCIETTLKDLVLLGKTKSPEDALTKAQVREALKRLEDYLGILVDHRASLQGAEDWNFTLKLWSRDKAENLKILESQWEERRIRNLKITQPKLKEEPLNQPSFPQRGIPFSAPPLPRCHIARPEHLNAVRELLLSEATPNTLVVSAISGMGGIGKSVLAAELVREKAVLERFQDGVLWATLGQEPDLLSIVTQWIQELGDYDYKPTTQDAASRHLGALLMDKQILLVIDDVWHPHDVKPFEILGLGCRLLVTTRQAQIMGALRYNLDVMTKGQSLELLRAYLGELLIPENLEIAEAFAREVGYLPLALALAAALIEDGLTWEELLEDFREEVARLETLTFEEDRTLTDEAIQKERSLKASFYLTLKQLSSEQLKQFAWLGVVPEDVSITQEMSATLWDVTVRQGGAILRALKNRALLLPQARKPDQPMTYRVHDLVHDLAKNLLTKQNFLGNLSGLGLSLEAAHSQLIKRYQSYTQDGLWSTLNDDGYIYSHLTWHFEKAKQPELIHQLFRETTSEGRNGWYEACDRLGQPGIFVADLGRAQRLSKDMYGEDESRSIGLQMRYALIFSSLNSLASNIPTELIAALVKKKKWSPAQGLVYARQVQQPKQRSEIIQALSAYLPHVLLSEALEMVREIQDESSRVSALKGLAWYLSEQLMSEALDIVKEMLSHAFRADVLSGLVPHLPEQLLSEALDIVRGIRFDNFQVNVLSSLAPRLPEQLMSEALDIVRGMLPAPQGDMLSRLARHLPEQLFPKALEMVREIQDESCRASALRGLVTYLPEQLLPEELEIAQGIQNESSRVVALDESILYSPSIASKKLEVVRGIKDESSRASALSELAPYLPEQLFSEVLGVVREIQDEFLRAHALSWLISYLPEQLLSDALKVTQEIQDERQQYSALRELVSYLPEQLSPKALEIVLEMQNEFYRANVLSELAPRLPEQLLPKALEMAGLIEHPPYQADALRGLAPCLPEQLLPKALEMARGIRDEYERVVAIGRLTAHSPEIVSEARESAQEIQHKYTRVIALLRGLTSHLPEMPEILSEALELVQGIQNESSRSSALRELVPYLPEQLLSEALEIVRDIKSENDRASALRVLAPFLPKLLSPKVVEIARGIQNEFSRSTALRWSAPISEQLLSEALEIAQGIQNESSRTDVLSWLAPHLPEKLLSEVLERVPSIDEHYQADVLNRLVPYLSEPLLSKAYEIAEKIPIPPEGVPALISLAPYLSDPLLSKALEVARKRGVNQAAALSRLAQHLPKQFLPEALEIAEGIQNESSRASALRALSQHFPEILPEALKTARRIQSNYDRASALGTLSQHFPEILSEALSEAFRIPFNYDRAPVFSQFASQLDLCFLDIIRFSNILHTLSCRERRQFLDDLPNLASVAIALSDRSVVKFMVQAIREVCQQWP